MRLDYPTTFIAGIAEACNPILACETRSENAPAAVNPVQCYGAQIRRKVFNRILQIKDEYEKAVNDQRASCDDGQYHNRFASRESGSGMTIPACVLLMMCMQGGDIHNELINSRLFHPSSVPSVSSYCHVRDKIPLDIIEDFFHWVVEEYYWTDPSMNLSEALHIMAVDGSELQYPPNPSEPDNYVKTRSQTKARNCVHMNCCVDTTRNFVVDIIIQDAHKKDERDANYTFIKRIASRFSNPDVRRSYLFTTDRGYEAWNLPVIADHYGVSFLCRIKSEDSNGILAGLKDLLPCGRNSFDRTITLRLTRDPSKKGQPGYHYLSPSTYCELCTKDHEYDITLRILKVRISDKLTEYLFTNLPKYKYDKQCMVRFYHRRWPCETSFEVVKFTLCLSATHAASNVPVRKEIFCRFAMFDLSSTLFNKLNVLEKKEDTGRKYDYVQDISSAMADIRAYFLSSLDYDIDTVVRRITRPDRENEPTERNKNPRHPTSFGHRMG